MKQLRPLIALLAIVAMSLTLYGCGGLNSTADSADKQKESTSEVQTTAENASPDGTPQAKENTASDQTTPESSPEQKDMITVHMSVDTSHAVDFGYDNFMFKGDVQVEKGTTVYDALKATGLAVSGTKSYVKSIGGLAERGCNQPGSGWAYSIDGVMGVKAANSAFLNGGETIVWKFIFDSSEVF